MADYIESLNKTELTYLTERFKTFAKGKNKDDYIAALREAGVTAVQAREAIKERKAEIEKSHPHFQESPVAATDPVILVRMRRANPYFEFRSYTFTNKDPFVIMKETDAETLMRHETGFFVATPQEAREYYGNN